jgi:response regulator RpfG family c-di-GMP phosphodiesterase
VAALEAVVVSEGRPRIEHARRLARLAVAIASRLDVPERHRAEIEKAALLREIDRLDVHALSRSVSALTEAEEIALATAERFDGTGFPLGLKGNAIHPGARILAVAEAYDEMTGGHGRGELAPALAVEVLCTGRAHEFDPAVLAALRALKTPTPEAPPGSKPH